MGIPLDKTVLEAPVISVARDGLAPTTIQTLHTLAQAQPGRFYCDENGQLYLALCDGTLRLYPQNTPPFFLKQGTFDLRTADLTELDLQASGGSLNMTPAGGSNANFVVGQSPVFGMTVQSLTSNWNKVLRATCIGGQRSDGFDYEQIVSYSNAGVQAMHGIVDPALDLSSLPGPSYQCMTQCEYWPGTSISPSYGSDCAFWFGNHGGGTRPPNSFWKIQYSGNGAAGQVNRIVQVDPSIVPTDPFAAANEIGAPIIWTSANPGALPDIAFGWAPFSGNSFAVLALKVS